VIVHRHTEQHREQEEREPCLDRIGLLELERIHGIDRSIGEVQG
jgi:hypothetical protein